MDKNDWFKIFFVACLFVLFFLAGVKTGQAHEPYPTSIGQANIYLKINAQKAAIDKQIKDQEIELKRLELELERIRDENYPTCAIVEWKQNENDFSK